MGSGTRGQRTDSEGLGTLLLDAVHLKAQRLQAAGPHRRR